MMCLHYNRLQAMYVCTYTEKVKLTGAFKGMNCVQTAHLAEEKGILKGDRLIAK